MKGLSKIRTIIPALLSILISVSLAGCGTVLKTFPSFQKQDKYQNISENIVAENNNIALKWYSKQKQIGIYDKIHNKEWGSNAVTAAGEEGQSKKPHPQVISQIYVGYFDQSNYTEKVAYSYTSAVSKNTVSSKAIKNGISVKYDFATEGFSVTVNYTLRENSVLASVDRSLITENEKNIVTRVALAPYFCSVKNETDDSYVFVPSGSGALVYPNVDLIAACETSEPVYGKDYTIDEEYNFAESKSVRMPVYGVKDKNSGLCAVIEGDPETADITTVSNNTRTGYTSVFPYTWVRGYNTIQMPESFGNDAYTKLFSSAVDKGEFSVAFYPFGGDDCSYVDIAEIYRDYLFKKYKTENFENKEKAVNLNILGGVLINKSFIGYPYKSIQELTTVTQAKDIINSVTEVIKNNFGVQLSGYTQSGMDIGKIAGGGTVSGKLGSLKEIRSLIKDCDSSEILIFMDFDMIRYKSGTGGAGFGGAAVKTDQKSAVKYYYKLGTGLNDTDESYRLLSRNKIEQVNNKFFKKLKKSGITGVSFNTMSNMCYSDYGNEAYFAKSGMSGQVSGIYKKYKDSGFNTGSSDANDYAAVFSDHISNAPLSSAEYDSFGATVPFYEIVFKGYVPMSSSGINGLNDNRKELLKAVEAGIGISFCVAENYSTKALGTVQNISYALNGSELKENISAIAKMGFFDYCELVKNAKITQHSIVDDNVRKTVFDNGVAVYVNYGDTAAAVNGISVAPQSFEVVQEAKK